MGSEAPSAVDGDPWDEMVDGHGRVRPHWHHLLATLGSLPGEGIEERARRLALPHHQEGLLFPTAGEREDDQPARCPLPVPLPAAEWEGLQAGLQQRARLLDRLLEDLYGPQHLLAHGDLPSYLVFGNPAFLRACRRPERAHERLRFCAVDLYRATDGRWRVLADVTGLPHGIGAARENRRLLSRVLPELFAGAHVRPLHPFFDLWVDSLRRLAPAERENPHLALLTPGLQDAAWTEHVFLARELGLSLVEDGDLTVRGGVALLKTLRGLEPVDVLLRFADSDRLDPLELNQEGAQGVAGLLDAHRTGGVTITNPPGSRLLETPGIYAFLPRLGRLLLGEELLLPQHPQWWCGDRGALAELLASPDRFELRSALDPRAAPVRMSGLAAPDRASLLDRVRAKPWDWVCLEPPALSTVPCQEGGRREPRRLVLRTFMVADESGPEVMPGGLARALAEGASAYAPVHRRSLSKDVWILAEDEAVIPAIRPSTTPPLPIRRMIGALPSRVADDFFWLGRYIERLDDVARLSRAVLLRLSRAALLPRDLAEVSQLARALAAAGAISADFVAPADGAVLRDALRFAWRSPQGRVRDLLSEIERLSDSVRDRFSGDMLASVQHFLALARRSAAHSDTFDDQLDAAENALRLATVLAGIAAENMVRGGSWLFLDLGRRLERASCQLRTLGVVLDLPPERLEMGLRLALELGDSVITYRNRYFSAVQLAPVVDLLLADASNPRALAYQLAAAARHLQELVIATGAEAVMPGAEALQIEADRLLLPWLDGSERSERMPELLDGLQRLQDGVMALSDEIVRHYFAHVPDAHTVGFAEAAAE